MVVGATDERNRVCDREYLERALASFFGLDDRGKSLRMRWAMENCQD